MAIIAWASGQPDTLVVGVPAISFSQIIANYSEGNSGTTTVPNIINVFRNNVAGALVVNLAYSGTATSGVDYATAPTSVTIASGANTVSFNVAINGDTTFEPDETIVITATLAAYPLAVAVKTITIVNDDAAAGALGPSTASFVIGAAGTTFASITGLMAEETIASITPNDNRIVINGAGTGLVVGLTASVAGTINYSLVTSAERSLAIAVTAGAGASASTYLPAVSSGGTPYVFVAKRMISGYNGNLLMVTRASDAATLNVAAATGSDFPDYAAINTWGAGSALTITSWYDQNGSGFVFTYPAGVASQAAPSFDTTQALNGCVPILWDGNRSSSPNSAATVAKVLELSGLPGLVGNNMSVVDIVAPLVSAQDNFLWCGASGTDADGSTAVGLATQASAPGMSMYATGGAGLTFPMATSAPRINPDVIIATYKTGGKELHIRRQVLTTTTAPSPSSIPLIMLGRRSGSTTSSAQFTFNTRARRWGFIIYPQALATADATTIRTAMYASFGIQTAFTSRVVFGTDSLMEGSGVSLCNNIPSQIGLSASVEQFNLGIHGQYLSGEYTAYASRVSPLYTATYGAGKCALVIEGSANDLRADVTAANLYSNTTTPYIAAAKATGFYTFLTTTSQTGDATETTARETQRGYYITSVRGNAASADTIIDVAADAVMGAAGVTANPTYYLSDLVHTTSIADFRLAQYQYKPALAAIGIS